LEEDHNKEVDQQDQVKNFKEVDQEEIILEEETLEDMEVILNQFKKNDNLAKIINY
jgi:non-homologous end joining protein Ku